MAALQAKVGDAKLGDPPTADTLALLNDHARQDWRDVCATASCPMLLIAGRDSQLWPAEHVRAVAGNANARSSIIDECGHVVNVERPEAFNAALLDFAWTCTGSDGRSRRKRPVNNLKSTPSSRYLPDP